MSSDIHIKLLGLYNKGIDTGVKKQQSFQVFILGSEFNESLSRGTSWRRYWRQHIIIDKLLNKIVIGSSNRIWNA
jgi:hypothetical protein